MASAQVEISSPCLEWLIQPVETRTFFERHWAEVPLLVHRNRPDYFRSVLTLDDIDSAIANLYLPFPDVTLVNAAREVKKEDYVLKDGVVDPAGLYREFGEGSTIILSQLQTKLPNLGRLCRELEAEFSFPFQTNVYLTPSNSRGFKQHYDTHDVLILQAAGSKQWKLYGTPVKLPLWGQDFDSKIHAAGPVTLECELKAGDVLYIPRGVAHDAESTQDISLHITVGILAYTWADLLVESLASVVLNQPDFRRPLPVGFAHPSFDTAGARSTFRALIAKFTESAELSTPLDEFVEQFISTRRLHFFGQMNQLLRVEELDLNTAVGILPHLVYRIVDDGAQIQLRCSTKAITFPKSARPALIFVLDRPDFVVHELPCLDAKGQLVFVKRLIREGLLRQL